ncbi:MAG: XdhC family protein, partial [Vulcanimicrobiaceae bacterium]
MTFTERIAELERERAPFAVATVVARLAPVSSHLGDRAIVFADGRMEGFVGGACSRDIVRRHARAALHSHKPLLLRVRPASGASEAAESSDDVVDVPMGCTSEGAVDIFVEPHVPRPHFLIAGFTPVADTLARVAATLDYVVERFVSHEELGDVPDVEGIGVHEIGALPISLDAMDPAARSRTVAVVASQGHYDEIALERLLAAQLAFVGLVASRKRAASV